ncbi:MAG: hypothetical protein RBS80_24510 [Thermoguttaceae bacterium]|jgi:hypothetical protein|nr:hypothetical protein [Thermoguttaceae bacterium]
MKRKALPARIITALDVLLACAVGAFLVWDSPYLQLDVWIVLTGIAFAAAACWHGQWSRSFLMRVAVAAYYFRCAVFYLAGNSTVRAIVLGHAAIALAAITIAYTVRWRLSGHMMPVKAAARQSLPQDADDVSTGCRNDDMGGATAGVTFDEDAAPTKTWSPLRVSARAVAVSVLAGAGLLGTAAVTGRPGLAAWILFVGLFWLLFVGCIRLIRLGSGAGE